MSLHIQEVTCEMGVGTATLVSLRNIRLLFSISDSYIQEVTREMGVGTVVEHDVVAGGGHAY